MLNPRPISQFFALAAVSGALLQAQDLGAAKDLAVADTPSSPTHLVTPEPMVPGRSVNDGSIFTRRDARTITLKIPAPRGQIVDREGEPLAQNRVAYQVGLQYSQFENADRDFVVNWARTRLDALQAIEKNIRTFTDDELYDHYENRRWLPLLATGELQEKEARALEPKLPSGLILQALYERYYPNDDLAAHIIGYSGSVGKLPTGPISYNEPIFEESEGRAGFEKLFNKELSGDPGMKRLIFDENGNKLLEEQLKRPLPGGTVVTTLDLKWQKLAESILKDGAQRGAFVVLDAATGEVLVMASRPSFDLNMFIPGIGEKDYKALNDDPATPLFNRAFQSVYPPASCFKPVVALTALNNGVVTPDSTIYCPAAVQIGDHVFKNWSKIPEGDINVERALARSNNSWFYQVGVKTGPAAFLSTAKRLGFGKVTGLPLIGESSGLVPDDAYMRRVHKRPILDGDTANMSIGQGPLLASPLQVAQAMAGIANGGVLPELHLIRQIQDTRGRVVNATMPERRNWLGISDIALQAVRDGMRDVVNSGYGTGRGAALDYTELCGKTGTAQWGPTSKNQRLAWFAGFLPHDNPRYSFAVVYEGRPGETVSGGRMAAPMVRKFFEGVREDIEETIKPPERAVVVVDESDPALQAAPLDQSGTDGEPLHALPVEPLNVPPADPAQTPDVPVAQPAEEAPPRALPVDPDEIIDDGTEEP
ncbi:hypothetical protein JIN85_16490 [Luteolibacter pohnpeiensis]|uniref:Penicillin-binding protein 2 n=1 Tax=Luteolibacter pohnpeiensis TaxID=454153 RepID=A0A934S6K1_9BACT|nr:penicillin-binding transpeptidase domain-containing protein [Luteolibacter pohnpeiensis]MBK1884020.1 hypothetical protein [Luteolibacter pohnpeiensis]